MNIRLYTGLLALVLCLYGCAKDQKIVTIPAPLNSPNRLCLGSLRVDLPGDWSTGTVSGSLQAMAPSGEQFDVSGL